jgi:V/A-type H+-transporting ATPase subunit C
LTGGLKLAEKDYAYAVGRIRALENKLLPVGFFERLLAAPSLEESARLLGETEYGSRETAGDFEDILEEQLGQLYQFLREQTDDAPELLVFLRRWDVHNLKLLVVAAGRGQPSKLGIIPFAELKKMVEGALPSALPTEINEVLADLPEHGPERAAALDRAYYRYGRRVLERSSQLLAAYWRARRDLLNLQLFLRLRKSGAPVKEFELFMVEPGYIGREQWVEHYTQPPSSLASLLNNTPYAHLVRGEAVFDALPLLEREIDNFLLELMKEAKFVPLGIEPVIGYLLAREREVLNLRFVFAGKKNELPVETVRRRLRNVYV